jgi:hypothetical protein
MGGVRESPGLLAFCVSFALHAGVGLAIASAPVLLDSFAGLPIQTPHPKPARREQPKPPPDQPQPEPEIRPGIENSDSNSVTWIGFAEATENAAPLSTLDQSGMTTGSTGTPVAPVPPGAASEEPMPEATEAAAKPAEEDPAQSMPKTEAGPSPEVVTSDGKAVPAPVNDGDTKEQTNPPPSPPDDLPKETRAPEVVVPSPTKPADTPEKPAPETPTPQPNETDTKPAPAPAVEHPDAKPERTGEPDREPVKEAGLPGPLPPQEDKGDQPEQQPVPPRPEADTPPAKPAPTAKPAHPRGATPRKSGKPAQEADKDADAMSVRKAVDYINGKVKAGQGLDIKTVSPDFSTFVRVTAAPRNPVVELAFDRSGEVVSVRFLITSGYVDVDEPIRDALWAWTAKGKEITELANKPAGAVVKMSFKILLHS